MFVPPFEILEEAALAYDVFNFAARRPGNFAIARRVTTSFRLRHLAMLLVVATLASAVGCAEKAADDVQIEKVIRDGAKAIEDNKISDAAEALADHYSDAAKRDKITLKRLAAFTRARGPVGLFLRDFKIDIDGADASKVRAGEAPDGATANVDVAVYAVQGRNQVKVASDLIPQGARKHAVTLKMQKLDGEWKVVSMKGDRLRASF